MGGFILARTIDGVIKLFLVSMILYSVLIILPPGNPAERFAGKAKDPAVIANIEREYCFDKGKLPAYFCFMKMTLSGDFKSPAQGNTNVIPRAFQAVPVTFGMAVLAAIIWLACGIAAGAIGATTNSRALDRTLMIVALIGISFPTAWLALLLLKQFTADIPIFPPGGYMSIKEGGLFNWFHSMLLPALTLAIVNAGIYTRMTRTTVRQKLKEEYVKTAEAKGLPRKRIFVWHVMRTAMIPILVMFGMDFAGLMGGAVFTESIFGLPGLGGLIMQALGTMDFAMLFIVGLLAASFVIISNTVVDLVQAVLDPKLRSA